MINETEGQALALLMGRTVIVSSDTGLQEQRAVILGHFSC